MKRDLNRSFQTLVSFVIPNTIKNINAFMQSPSAGFDGVFDWSYLSSAFPGKIDLMDFDGVVERKGNFLAFETKDAGKEVPDGQMITLTQAHYLEVFTIFFLWGKVDPVRLEIWRPSGRKSLHENIDQQFVFDKCVCWFEWADKHPTIHYRRNRK